MGIEFGIILLLILSSLIFSRKLMFILLSSSIGIWINPCYVTIFLLFYCISLIYSSYSSFILIEDDGDFFLPILDDLYDFARDEVDCY